MPGRRDGEVRDLGHGGPGEVPLARPHVLQRRAGRHRRLRHHQSGWIFSKFRKKTLTIFETKNQ